MAKISKDVKFTLDGKHKVTVGDGHFNWSGHFIGRLDVWTESGNHTATVTLTGSNWTIGALDLFADQGGIKLIMKDANDGADRTMKYLETDDAGSVITLKSTYIKDLEGNDGVDKVTLGDQGAGSVHLGGGNDTVTGTSGSCDFVGLGDGNNTYKSGNMWAGIVLAFGGNDTFTVNGNGQAESLDGGSGNNTFNVIGNAWVGAILGNSGNDTVNVSTSNSVDMIRLSNGDNTLTGTGSGWIGSVLAFEGKDTIDLTGSTAQYAGYFALGDGDNVVRNGNVFIESIVTNAGNDTFTIGAGGAGQITSWGSGNDTLTSQGWIGSILFNSGTDSVTLLAGGAALSVVLRNGNDSLSVSEITSSDVIDQTCLFNGGNDVDTISFAQFTHSVDIDLGNSNAVDTGHGIFIVRNFEKLIGGSAADTLEGQGDGGQLTGGGGGDTFVLADGDGNITVTDFLIAEADKIDLSGLSGIDDFTDLSTNHMSQNGADTEITGENGEMLALSGIDKDDLTTAQFTF